MGSEPVSSRPNWRGPLAEYLGMLLVLAAMLAYFGMKAEHFFTSSTFRTIANQIPDATILAVGMTFVLLIGGIDLSIGSVLALSGGVLGICLLKAHWPLPMALAACLLVGLACGILNGLTVVRFGLPSFIVTLGMLEAARGGAYLVTNSQTQYIGSVVERISEISLSGLSLPFLLALLIVAAAHIVLWRTRFGRYVYAIGSNEEAARLSGINVRAVKLSVFALCGLLAAVAAIINVSRLASADPNAGSGFELQAIAAVVIGGTSLLGGRGSVLGSLFGVLIIAVLGNGLAQIGAQEPTKRLITGLVIVLAVVADVYRAKLLRKTPG
jgi:ribose transport system permease protein